MSVPNRAAPERPDYLAEWPASAMHTLPDPGALGCLSSLTIDGLTVLHEAVYADVLARLGELEKMRMRFLWRPAWRRGMRQVRARQADLTMIGAELLERWDAGRR